MEKILCDKEIICFANDVSDSPDILEIGDVIHNEEGLNVCANFGQLSRKLNEKKFDDSVFDEKTIVAIIEKIVVNETTCKKIITEIKIKSIQTLRKLMCCRERITQGCFEIFFRGKIIGMLRNGDEFYIDTFPKFPKNYLAKLPKMFSYSLTAESFTPEYVINMYIRYVLYDGPKEEFWLKILESDISMLQHIQNHTLRMGEYVAIHHSEMIPKIRYPIAEVFSSLKQKKYVINFVDDKYIISPPVTTSDTNIIDPIVITLFGKSYLFVKLPDSQSNTDPTKQMDIDKNYEIDAVEILAGIKRIADNLTDPSEKKLCE